MKYYYVNVINSESTYFIHHINNVSVFFLLFFFSKLYSSFYEQGNVLAMNQNACMGFPSGVFPSAFVIMQPIKY